ncbi:MAG: xylulokinase [Pseudoruegeria sp.]
MYLGLDLGTSGLRALLVNASGVIIGSAEQSCSVQHPFSGWSEQNPAEWIAACEGAVGALKSRFPEELSALRGIGLSGHMHGATLLGADDQVLRPCILWNDTRSAEEAAALDQTKGVRDLSGNIVFPGFTAPKLMWLAKHEPDVFAKVRKVLLPKDYLRFWLTGELCGDMSDAAGTSWLDVGARDWSNQLLEASGMDRDQMPALVEGSEVSGMLRSALSSEWGITAPVAVVGGGGDNAVAACGVGCFSEGDGFVSLGTSGVVLAAKSNFSPSPATAVHTFCHAVPDTWYQMGVILAATDCMNWLAGNLGQSPAALSGLLSDRVTGPGAVKFLPYLSGERTPHNDSSIRGALVGLDISTDHAALTQAVMEGVGFALRDNFEALKSTGTDLTRVLGIGGGANSRYWIELIATLLNVPVDLPEAGDFGAALGAARLAMVGVTGASLADVMTRPIVAETIEPRADLTGAYDEAYSKYRALYPALKVLNT